MAFAPQQYNNMNKNMNQQNNNTNRRVQFSIHGKNTHSTSSSRSLPNPNPLTQQESMPYRPELDQYNSNISPPQLSKNVKSIEINNKINKITLNSNHSTPESILNEPMPSQNRLAMNTSNSINHENTMNTMNIKPNNLMDQESHRIEDSPNTGSPNTNSPNTNSPNTDSPNNALDVLPITDFANNNKAQQYYRQQTMSNGSYDHIPALYSDTSQIRDDVNNTNVQPPPLPNTTSIALDSQNEMKQNNKLSLNEHFSNDVKAFETWMACCDIQDDTFGYYSALYPLLCEIFAENTKCSRVPKQCDLEEVILKHGAKKMKLSKLNSMHNVSGTITSDLLRMQHLNNNNKKNDNNITPPVSPPALGIGNSKHLATVSSGSYGVTNNGASGKHGYSDTISFDFDNPDSTPKYLVTIKYKSFYKFWKWFKECCHIIRELSHLWDANEQSILQCNLFCGREECQKILEQAPQGTFMLRLSSVIRGGIVLSYCEPSYSKKDKKFKHTILIRRRQNEYELRSHSKSKNKKGNNQLTTISSLVRSFVKIKFLYTPNNLYPKKSVF